MDPTKSQAPLTAFQRKTAETAKKMIELDSQLDIAEPPKKLFPKQKTSKTEIPRDVIVSCLFEGQELKKDK